MVGHLVEIVTLHLPEFLNFLTTKEMLTMGDLCIMELYRKAYGLDEKEYLQWAKDDCGLGPDRRCIDAAVSGEHENVVDFIAKEFNMKMVPSQSAVNEAAANGTLKLLVKGCPGWELKRVAKPFYGAKYPSFYSSQDDAPNRADHVALACVLGIKPSQWNWAPIG